MIGLVDRERVDEELYDDYETAKAREVCMLVFGLFLFSPKFVENSSCCLLFSGMQKRLAKEARAQETQAKNATLGKKVKEPPVSKGMKGRGEASFYKVTCKV